MTTEQHNADDMLKELFAPEVVNADNEILGPLKVLNARIGFVDEVNGRAAEEVEGFVATRHELIQLAKYWAKKAIDIEFFWFCYSSVSSSERRLRPFAWRRVSRISKLLGEKEVDEAIKQVYDEFGKNKDPKAWNLFLNGTPDEQQEYQEYLRSQEALRGDSGS